MEDRISGLEDERDSKEKTRRTLTKDSRAAKGICKKSATPSKDQA
jgi:hypothetical protein